MSSMGEVVQKRQLKSDNIFILKNQNTLSLNDF